MKLGKVTGSIVSTQKNHSLVERKILIVQPVGLDGRPTGSDVLALDTVDAGVNDMVLIMQEGAGARQILNRTDTPVHTVIVAVVDGIDIHSQQ